MRRVVFWFRLAVIVVLVLWSGIIFADDAVQPTALMPEMNCSDDYTPPQIKMPTPGLKLAWPSAELAPYLNSRVDTLGYTYYDMQHNYTNGRNIVLDESGIVHICWMWSPTPDWSSRHIYYNCVFPSPAGSLFTEGGLQVDGATRSGYTNITLAKLPIGPMFLDTVVNEVEVPFIAFHATYSTIPDFHTDIVWDGIYRAMGTRGGFTVSEDGTGWSMPPYSYTYSTEYEPYYPDLVACPDSADLLSIWPRIAAIDSNVYLVSTPSNTDTLCGVPVPDYVVFWSGKPSWEGDWIHEYTWSEPLLLDFQYAITADIAVDENSGKIAVAYHEIYDSVGCDATTWAGVLTSSELVYRTSTDNGVTWSERQTILGHLSPDGFPIPEDTDTFFWPIVGLDTVISGDSIYIAAIDTQVIVYRTWGNTVSLTFDDDGYLHVVFDALMFFYRDDEFVCDSSGFNCATAVLYWNERDGEVIPLVNRMMPCGTTPGASRVEESDDGYILAWRTAYDPSIGIDDDGNVYVIWQQAWPLYSEYRDSLVSFAYAHEGTLDAAGIDEWDALLDSIFAITEGYVDVSAEGIANLDIYGIASTDGGMTWGKAFNLSNTHSAGCEPGECACEINISMARRVDDYVHIFTELDLDAGMFVRGSGAEATNNPIYHIAVPVDTFLNYSFPAGIVEHQKSQPHKLAIGAYPNPFNSAANIIWTNPIAGDVSVEIVDISGRIVKKLYDGYTPAGTHSSVWDGTDRSMNPVPSGTYLCRIKSGEMTRATRITLIK